MKQDDAREDEARQVEGDPRRGNGSERSQVLVTVGSLVLEIGHQLMNPLFAMSSALDALEARVGDDPVTFRHRALLREQVRRATKLVSGLQEYGRLGDLEPGEMDLTALVHRLAAAWSEEAESAGVAVQVEAPDGADLRAHLDPEAFGRALGHLVSNACQHAPAGTSVRVTVGAAEAAAEELEITIEDRGPGFLEEDLELVTTPLTSRRPGGAGLGLAIAERIVHLHHGSLELGSTAEGGARVRVRLPRLEASPAAG